MRGWERGHAVVWALVAVAAVAATALLAARGADGLDGTRRAFLAVAALVLVAGVAIELRRDPWVVAAIGAASGATGAIVFGLVAAADVTPSPVARTAAVVFGAIGVVSAIVAWREPRRPEQVPNVVPRRIPGAFIAERNGVQIALESPPEGLAARAVLVYLQNCFDAERHVEIDLEAEHVPPGSAIMREAGGGGRAVRIPPAARVEARLEPLEVGVMVVPFRVLPGPRETVEMVASVRIAGELGRRVRRWRAPTATRKLSPARQFLFSLLTRKLVRGGGFRLRLVVPEAILETVSPAAARPAWTPLWRPGWGEPKRRRRPSPLTRSGSARRAGSPRPP